MMQSSQIFRAVLSVSISGAVIALLLMAVRSLFVGKIRPYAYLIMWGMIAIRLLLPYTFESNFSMYNYAPEQVQRVVDAQSFAAIGDFVSPEFVPVEQSGPANIIPDTAPRSNAVNPVQQSDVQEERSLWQIALERLKAADPWSIAAVVWIAGAAVITCYMGLVNLAMSLHLKKNRRYESEKLAMSLSAARANSGVKREVSVLATGSMTSPAVFGVMKPRLLIPFKAFEVLAVKHQEYVLTHELLHIKYGDTFALLVINIICALHWFNPVIWIAARYARRDLELMCDARTVRAMNGTGEDYAGALISAAQSLKSGRNVSLMIAAVDKKKDIKWRIKMIMKQKTVRSWLSVTACVLAFAVALAGCTAAVSDIVDAVTPPDTSTAAPTATPSAAPEATPAAQESQLETLPLPDGYTPLTLPEELVLHETPEFAGYPDTERWAYSYAYKDDGTGYDIEELAAKIWPGWTRTDKNTQASQDSVTVYSSDSAGSDVTDGKIIVEADCITYHKRQDLFTDKSTYLTDTSFWNNDEDLQQEIIDETVLWLKDVLGDIDLLKEEYYVDRYKVAVDWKSGDIIYVRWNLSTFDERGLLLKEEYINAQINTEGVYCFNYYVHEYEYTYYPLETPPITVEQALYSFNYQRAKVKENPNNHFAAIVSDSLRIINMGFSYNNKTILRDGAPADSSDGNDYYEMYVPYFWFMVEYDAPEYEEPRQVVLFMDCATGNLDQSNDEPGEALDFAGNTLLLSPFPEINNHQELAGKLPHEDTPAPNGGQSLSMETAHSMTKEFIDHVNLSLYTMESATLPDYAVDSASVHLYLRWHDYRIAMLSHSYNADERYSQPANAEVKLTLKEQEIGRVSYDMYVTIHQRRVANGVIGQGMNGMVEFEYVDGGWKISEFDVTDGPHRSYTSMREALEGYDNPTAETVDKIVDREIDYFKKNN